MATDAGSSKRCRVEDVENNVNCHKCLKLQSEKESANSAHVDTSGELEVNDSQKTETQCNSEEYLFDSDEHRPAVLQIDDQVSKVLKKNTEIVQNNDGSIDSQKTELECNSEEYLINSEEYIVSQTNNQRFKLQKKTTEVIETIDDKDICTVDSQKTEINDTDTLQYQIEDAMQSVETDIQGTLSRESTENYSIDNDKSDINSHSASEQGESHHNKEKLPISKIASVQRDAEVIASVLDGVDIESAYRKLKDNRNNPDRVDIVTNDILENPSPVVIEAHNKLEKEDSLSIDPAFRDDPLYRDMLVVTKVLPDKDPNEIYAFLEAHHDKSNRILIVIQELTKTDSLDNESIIQTGTDLELDISSKGKGVKGQRSSIQIEVDQLNDIFPDCDPNYLYTRLEENQEKVDRVAIIVADMFEHKNYPKLKDTLETSEKNKKKHHYANLKFDMVDFLHKFPNPMEEFENEVKSMSSGYIEHCLIHLKNQFPRLKDGYIKQVFETHNQHFTPTLREIQLEIPSLRAGSKKFRRRARVVEIPFPEEPDEIFFHELLFALHEPELIAHLQNQKKVHAMKIEQAKDNNELYECGCCFDDVCLFEEMSSCSDGHLFCNGCVKGSAESAIGEGKTVFPCLTGECEHSFPLSVLQIVLSPNKFSIALKKMQEEELRKADIPDLVSCPFCSFATIMTNPDDTVFKCLNPECLKESCRLCKEPNHVPLRCNEVEKQGETSMRAFIELKMTEAMFRTCPECRKRFYKEDGCSMMTCPCGQSMCYACRETGIGYDHFNSCPVKNHDVSQLHQVEMENAAEEARAQYLEEHPEAEDTVLKYDPLKHLDNLRKRGGMISEQADDDYDDSDDYNSDFDE